MSDKEAAYASLIEGMDKSLGDIMDWLEKNGEADNTIVIFMSDNGGYATGSGWRDEPLYTQNFPLKCGKGSAYEGGIREPMIVRWPGTVQPGTRCNDYLIIEDFYPSILEMAGIDDYDVPQEIDGISFVPLLKQTKNPSQGRSLYWNCPNIWGENGSGTEKSLFLFRTIRGIVSGRCRIILHGHKTRIGKKAATIGSLNHPGSRSQNKTETNLFGIKTHISSI